MKFKIDENLPAECADMLRRAGFDASTTADESLAGANDSTIAGRCTAEHRVLVTLDLDFGNLRAYPPAEHAGIIVLRPKRQDKRSVVALLQRLVSAIETRSPSGELWIVEPDRIRFRVE